MHIQTTRRRQLPAANYEAHLSAYYGPLGTYFFAWSNEKGKRTHGLIDVDRPATKSADKAVSWQNLFTFFLDGFMRESSFFIYANYNEITQIYYILLD